jgi:hypothetical protein
MANLDSTLALPRPEREQIRRFGEHEQAASSF